MRRAVLTLFARSTQELHRAYWVATGVPAARRGSRSRARVGVGRVAPPRQASLGLSASTLACAASRVCSPRARISSCWAARAALRCASSTAAISASTSATLRRVTVPPNAPMAASITATCPWASSSLSFVSAAYALTSSKATAMNVVGGGHGGVRAARAGGGVGHVRTVGDGCVIRPRSVCGFRHSATTRPVSGHSSPPAPGRSPRGASGGVRGPAGWGRAGGSCRGGQQDTNAAEATIRAASVDGVH